jgi:uncharacterized membrane protein (DUF485 family)
MADPVAEQIAADPEYLELVRRRGRFAWCIALIPTVLLVGFLACLGSFPGFMARPLTAGGLLTVGLAFGLLVIFVSLGITALYLHVSSRRFEPVQKRLRERLSQRT